MPGLNQLCLLLTSLLEQVKLLSHYFTFSQSLDDGIDCEFNHCLFSLRLGK